MARKDKYTKSRYHGNWSELKILLNNMDKNEHFNYQVPLQFVTLSQPINALAFVFDGLYYGVADYAYAAYSMVLVGLLSSVFLLIASPISGLPGIWAGLFLFMFLRTTAGFLRLGSKAGPWKMVWSEDNRKLNQATEEWHT